MYVVLPIVIVGLSINIINDRPDSFKAAGHLDILQTATGAQGSHCCIHDPTHCSRDKHLARPHINKKKWKEAISLPCLVCLLRNKNVNKYYELQKGDDSAQ